LTVRPSLRPPRLLARALPAALCAVLLAACAGLPRGGYPHHDEAPSLDPPQPARDDAAMYLDLIRQMQQQGAYYASLAHIDAYRQLYGDPPELRRLQADALRETRQYDAARELYRRLLDTAQAAAAWHGLGLIEAAQRRYAEAEPALLRATQLEPINTAYLGDLGYARLCAGRIAEAREPLAKAAELEPASAKAVSNLALWALLADAPAQAEAIMQRAGLPAATRNAVRGLAAQLRLPRGAPDAGATRPPRGPLARLGSSSHAAATAPVTGVPAPLLDRLGTSASKEAYP